MHRSSGRGSSLADAGAMTISRTELMRMRASVRPSSAAAAAAERRAALKKRSEERVARWPNTLAAQRKAKAEARRRREEEEEAKRRAVDAEEEEHRRAGRREAIARASTLMYEQTDRMKELRSQKLLADVLKDREYQVQQKRLRREMEVKREKYWEKVGEAEREKLYAREIREKEEATDKASAVAHTQQLQLEDFKKRYVSGLMAEKAEGERVLASAAIALEKEKAKAQRVRERAIADAKAVLRQNEAVKEQRRREKEEEAALLLRIEEEAAAKERMQARREKAESIRHAAKMERTQRMIDSAVAHLESLQSSEDARLERQVAEAKEKRDKELADRDARRARQEEAIHRSRQAQLTLREQRKKEEVASGRKFADQWRQQQKRIEDEERRERAEQRRRAKIHAEFLQKQAEEKRLVKARDRRADVYEATRGLEGARREDARFEKEVRGVLEQYTVEGKNTIAIGRTLLPKSEFKQMPV